MTISKIYEKSIDVLKKSKSLLVVGMFLAMMTSGGMSFNFPSNSFNFKDNINEDEFETDVENTESYVDDEMVVSAVYSMVKESVNPFAGVFLIISILASTIFSFIVGLIAKGWGTGALIGGINEVLKSNIDVDLSKISGYGVAKLKPLILLSILISIISTVLVALPSLAFGLVLWQFNISDPSNMGFWGYVVLIFGSIFLMLYMFIAFVVMRSVSVYSSRIIVIDNKSIWESLKGSFGIFMSNKLDTIILGIVNTASRFFISFFSLLLMGMLFIPGVLAYLLLKENVYYLIPIVGYVIVPIILLISLLAGCLTVFFFSTWNVLYLDIKERSNGKL